MAARGTRGKKAEAVEIQATLDAVKNLDTAKVVSEVNNLQVTLQATLAQVSASITSKIEQIGTIDAGIRLKQDRLKELFAIEAEAISMDELKALREAEKVEWEKERTARNNQWAEEEAEKVKVLKRDEMEWRYSFDQSCKMIKDAFNLELSDAKIAESRRQAELDKGWLDREAALVNKEVEFTTLRKQVEGFEDRLKSEVNKAEAIQHNVLKRQHEHEKALLTKDADSAKAICEMRVTSLENAIANREEQIDELKLQLLSARQDAKDVATSALSATSERKVADALRQVIDRDNQPTKVK